MNEQEKDKIRKQAQELLEKFGKSLENVKLKEKRESKDVGGFREEGLGNVSDGEFRARVFENAPEKSGDFIIAEKKKW